MVTDPKGTLIVETGKMLVAAGYDPNTRWLPEVQLIKYNFDVLERDYLPEEKDPRQEESPER